MAIRKSTGLRNWLAARGGLKRAFMDGQLEIRTGGQSASADDADSGTLLVTVSLASGAITNEVLPTGSLVFSSGTGSDITSVTVDGKELLSGTISWTTDLDTTMALVEADINSNISFPDYTASYNTGTDTLTISALPGAGTESNGDVVAHTVSGGSLVLTENNMASGVDPVNGLPFGDASAGILQKDGSLVWSGVAIATGTAGHFRLKGSVSDAGGSSTTELRLDGTIGTTGSDFNMSSTSITSGATTTIDTAQFTVPV